MIASLRGELIQKSSDRLIVEVAGVGYDIHFCQSGAAKLPDIEQQIFIHIYMNVREDALDLYGFMNIEEKDIFVILLQVSGIGPKVALNILSAIDPAELAQAIRSEDLLRLTKLPGIGKKTAERLCLELKDKVQSIALSEKVTDFSDDHLASVAKDVISALVNLGYSQVKAKEAFREVSQTLSEDDLHPPLEELLRLTLRSLA